MVAWNDIKGVRRNRAGRRMAAATAVCAAFYPTHRVVTRQTAAQQSGMTPFAPAHPPPLAHGRVPLFLCQTNLTLDSKGHQSTTHFKRLRRKIRRQRNKCPGNRPLMSAAAFLRRGAMCCPIPPPGHATPARPRPPYGARSSVPRLSGSRGRARGNDPTK